MFKFAKITIVAGVLATLTASTRHIGKTKNKCRYEYLFHTASAICKMIGVCGPAANQ